MTTRRSFLNTTAKAAGLAMVAPYWLKKASPLLSFSTLGCPKWSFDQVLNCAATNGFKGIELRGLMGELDLPKCPEFSSPERIRESRQKLKDKGITIVNLGSSANLHFADTKKRTEQLDHAKRFIDLAVQLDCPYVRVFPNDLPPDQDRDKTIDLITSGLVELGAYVGKGPVSILLESHGKVIESGLLRQIMADANRPNVGLIWDVVNMWSVTKEPPAKVYAALKPYIRHTHLKDLRIVGTEHKYTLLGQGEAPLAEAINALTKGGYQGYYSFEWEKLWHPEIEEPEVAIPHYTKAIQRYFS